MLRKPFCVYGREINERKLFFWKVNYNGQQGIGYVTGSPGKERLESFIPRNELWEDLEKGPYIPMNDDHLNIKLD